MWVFLEAVSAVADIADVSGGPPRSEQLINLHPDGLAVDLARERRSAVEFSVGGRRVHVSYNASYAPASPDPRLTGRRATYLGPTAARRLARGGAIRTVRVAFLLDAKYRVEHLGSIMFSRRGRRQFR